MRRVVFTFAAICCTANQLVVAYISIDVPFLLAMYAKLPLEMKYHVKVISPIVTDVPVVLFVTLMEFIELYGISDELDNM